MRNLHLDALRGYCLVVMTIDHLHVRGLSLVTQDTFGFFDAAEGFIFISGLVAASYYSRLAESRGEAAMTKRALRRARDIYLTHVALFAFMLGGAVLLLPRHPATAHITGSRDWVHTPHPLTTLLLAATLLVQPKDFDILPFYSMAIMLVPLLVRGWRAGPGIWLLSFSAGFWLLSQPGVFVHPPLPAWVDLGNFKFFAWQFLFVSGFTLARLQQNQVVGTWFDSSRTMAAVLALLIALFVLRHARIILGPGFVDLRAADSWWVAKHTLGPLCVLNFGLFVYIVARTCIHYGPRLEKTLPHRVLSFLGQHSLQVFAWSLVISYAIPLSYPALGVADSRVAQIALGLPGVATLVIPARLHASYRGRLMRRASSAMPEGSHDIAA